MGFAMTLSEVLEWYQGKLHEADVAGKRGVAKQFAKRLRAQPEAAQAEAVVYHFLSVKKLNPQFLESPSLGGLDFECYFGEEKFAVEVTSFADETVTNRSGFPDELSELGYINLPSIISLVRSRISQKAVQASAYVGPRVLAIGSTHIVSSVLFTVGVEEFLTGETQIAFPVNANGLAGEIHMATELTNSSYLRSAQDGVESYRPKYALVLFVAIHGGGAHVTGIVHPAPEIPLSIAPFGNVPFARIKWPIDGNELRVEWIIADPRPDQHYFIHI